MILRIHYFLSDGLGILIRRPEKYSGIYDSLIDKRYRHKLCEKLMVASNQAERQSFEFSYNRVVLECDTAHHNRLIQISFKAKQLGHNIKMRLLLQKLYRYAAISDRHTYVYNNIYSLKTKSEIRDLIGIKDEYCYLLGSDEWFEALDSNLTNLERAFGRMITMLYESECQHCGKRTKLRL